MSPEVLLHQKKTIDYSKKDKDFPDDNLLKFGMKSDMWAIGVIAYIMICHKMPFEMGDNQKINK